METEEGTPIPISPGYVKRLVLNMQLKIEAYACQDTPKKRSGSDLHLRQTMKQTDYSKSPPLQDLSPPAVKSPCIYDVAPSPPPQPYEKSGHIYDTKKSPDYDVHPSPKAAAGGVTRRMKKSETAKQPRPKSWHTADGSETWEDPGFRTSPKPVAQTLPQPAPQQAPHLHSPRLDPMEKLTVIETFHKRPLPHSNTHSMINLHDFKDEAEPGHGFVKRRVSEYIYSSNQELSSSRKDKDFYFVCSDKRESLTPFNPKFRDVNLQPAETYPKVAMATQIKSAQQKAYIGRVPGTQTPPESQPHTCSSSQVVSYSTVQMPERHYASTMKLTGKYCDENTLPHQQKPEPQVSPTSGHLVYRATPRMSPSPTFSDKREPPTPPQRGDSRNRTQQMSEQRKRPSWPLHAHKMQDNSGRPSSITLEAPPVKLSPQQDQPRPSLITGEPELLYTYSGEPHPDIPTSTSSVSQGELETVGSNTFPGMNRNRDKVDYLYTAVPLYVDPGSDDPETGINSFFPSSSPQNVPEKQSSLENQPRGSPPTRDSVDRITVDSDPLVAALESYMRTAVDHEEQLHGVNPEDSSTGSESPVHHPRSVSHGDHNRPQCQTQPMSITRNEGEKRLSRTSLSSLDSHSSSGHRVKSPTSRLSSDEEEQNRKNSQLGNANQRTWKNPNDFSSKKAEIDTEKHWQDIVRLANPNWGDKYQQSDLSTNSKSEGHVRTSSQIDEKLIRGNAPGIRSPISPLMMEAVTTIEPSKPETIIETQQKEIKFLKAEGRDSGYEVDSENPFRSQQESPVPHVTDTFSSDDWMKMGNMESTGGTSILSQLQKETPYSQHYMNGEPIVKPTANQKTANESSRQKVARSEASITQTRNSRPQPVCPPKSRDDFFKDVKGPTGQVVKDERSVCGSQPQLSRPGGSDSSSRHYHSSSLDLDTKATGAQLLAQPSFPPWKPESSNDSSSVFHTRSHSYSGGGYPSYSGPSEPRFSRIDEEQGVESSESVPSSQSTNRPDRRSAGGPLNRSHGSYDGEGRSHRRGDSDPNSGPFPVRKTSVESKGKADSDYRHGYSKSDSERHRKSSATDQWHKNSDPSGAISKPHRVSDSHENIREVLGKYVETKRNLLRSDGTVFGSNQGSLSGYGSMASLDQSSRFSSTTSLYGKPGWSMDSVDHSRQSSYSSQASHAHRDSGIVSPSESSWGPPSPNTSPPGAMDHRPRNQQRVLDHHHQRAASDSTHRTERVRDTNSLGRSSLSMSDEYRPTKKVSRSNSMIHSSRVRPQVTMTLGMDLGAVTTQARA
ncbi:uncharacterized protein LOC110977222 isoform X3 [Acanthaster planci]|uniref:Uncharacterized protein LOC110977222 isoform X3 n=1 Tax=Acanthaster planci TaxID=133434 RepID=A0A8B7Y4Q5_ACAPL|nr:uncharacterized protein LOC110977222 isoform X3 [Acanthaster planci]